MDGGTSQSVDVAILLYNIMIMYVYERGLAFPSTRTRAWQAPSTMVASLGASGMPLRPSDAASLPPPAFPDPGHVEGDFQHLKGEPWMDGDTVQDVEARVCRSS